MYDGAIRSRRGLVRLYGRAAFMQVFYNCLGLGSESVGRIVREKGSAIRQLDVTGCLCRTNPQGIPVGAARA